MEQDYLEKRAKELKERFEKYYKEKEDLKIHFLDDDHQNIKNIEKDMNYPMKLTYNQPQNDEVILNLYITDDKDKWIDPAPVQNSVKNISNEENGTQTEI